MIKRILIAMATKEDGCALMHEFCSYQSWDEIAVTSDGKQVCQWIQEKQPEAVILDFHLSGLDGLGVLEWLQESGQIRIPNIYMLFYNNQESWIQMAYNMGAEYCGIKPCDAGTLYQRILQSDGDSKNTRLRLEIANALVQMGIPPHIRGYQYIIEGIMLAVGHTDLLNEMTGKFYPRIAEAYHTTPANVERSMRRAVELAWKKQDNKVLCDIFGKDRVRQRKPTNSEFIACLMQRYRYHYCYDSYR